MRTRSFLAEVPHKRWDILGGLQASHGSTQKGLWQAYIAKQILDLASLKPQTSSGKHQAQNRFKGFGSEQARALKNPKP